MVKKGKVIFLNGTTSSGKSTLSHCLLEMLPEQYHYLSVDTFMQMDPEWYLEQAFQQSIAYLSDRGINTIVDYVLLDTPGGKALFDECLDLLANHPVLFVRVECPLAELERRERERGDRSLGQAKWQFEHIHGHATYDVIVNTFEMTVKDCSEAILVALARPEKWKAFTTLKSRLDFERYHSVEMTVSNECPERDLDFIWDSIHQNALKPAGEPANLSEQSFDWVARDQEGAIIGGILCKPYRQSLKIIDLWVDDNYHGKDAADRLISAAENKARESGCTIAHTQAYGYPDPDHPGRQDPINQALEIFKKQGYAVYGILDGLEGGLACYSLKKRLDSR